MTNLELYRIFLAVAEEENLTKASEKLHISQPAVTKQIKNLEEALRVKLFVRTNHGICLTPKGQKIYEEIQEPLRKMLFLDEQYRKVKNINLGVHSTILNKILGKCISQYYQKKESCKINTFNLENVEMLSKLRNKQLDIIFSKKLDNPGDTTKIKFIQLGVWKEVLVANKNSKWIKKPITVEDMKKETIYMPKKTSETTYNFLKSMDCRYEEFEDIRHITYKTIAEILENAGGIGVVTKEFLEQELEEGNIKIISSTVPIKPVAFGIYINVDNTFKELKQLIEVIKKHFSYNE